MNALADIWYFPAYNVTNCRRTEGTMKYTENRTGKLALKQNLMVELSLKWSIMNSEASFRRLNMSFSCPALSNEGVAILKNQYRKK